MKFSSDNTFLINLDRRPDRLSEATAQLKRVGIDFTRYSAVDGRNIDKVFCERVNRYLSGTELACLFSHINIWKKAIQEDISEIAIFEDDVIFSEDFNERFPLFLENLPLEAEIIHLGPKTLKSIFEPLNQFVAVLRGTYYGTHAYIVKRKAMNILVSNNNNVCTPEMYMSEILLNNNIHHFCPLTQLCWQSNSLSDIDPNRSQRQVGPGFL